MMNGRLWLEFHLIFIYAGIHEWFVLPAGDLWEALWIKEKTQMELSVWWIDHYQIALPGFGLEFDISIGYTKIVT